jgi:hypothetical protein
MKNSENKMRRIQEFVDATNKASKEWEKSPIRLISIGQS